MFSFHNPYPIWAEFRLLINIFGLDFVLEFKFVFLEKRTEQIIGIHKLLISRCITSTSIESLLGANVRIPVWVRSVIFEYFDIEVYNLFWYFYTSDRILVFLVWIRLFRVGFGYWNFERKKKKFFIFRFILFKNRDFI